MGKTYRWAAAISLTLGCLPTLKDECQSDDDCAAGRCTVGLCAPLTVADGAPDGALPDGPPADGSRDAAPDAAPDGRAPDAEPDGAIPDAAADLGLPPDQTVDVPPDEGPPPPGEEVCNGDDDDGDGLVDESGVPGEPLSEVCFDGNEAWIGEGVCRAGVRACDGGELGPCMGQVLPSGEVCNNLDDNCNGAIDEGVHQVTACYSGPEDTLGVGECASGRLNCIAGEPSGCEGEVLPTEEVCDAADNDCDGLTDEGRDCECAFQGERACYGGPPGTAGVGACRPGGQVCLESNGARRVGPCEGEVRPTEEVCDGEDNDCDGAIDEFEVPDCAVGVGACRAQGQWVCSAGAPRCNAVEGAPALETCDARDNDCDGTVDEGATTSEGCDPVPAGGACSQGVRACAEGRPAGPCQGRVEPAAEVCNEIDDNCDGRVDEGCECADGTQVVCGEGPRTGVGVCRAGRATCRGGAFGACEGAVGPSEETCNGADDDCNGVVDDAPGTDAPCTAGLGACERGGRIRCVDGDLACDARPAPAGDEVCNGEDDDCDGRVDEGLMLGACTVGQGECQRPAQRVCDGGEVVCAGDAGAPTDELCDGLDNDCDGLADEAFAIGEDCTTAVLDCIEVPGALRCTEDGGTACHTDFEPGPEVCDGLDNDCDGGIDELAGRGNDCEDQDTGCRGALTCVEGSPSLVCVGDAPDAGPDLCDGQDSDCDGVDGEDDCRNGSCVDAACDCAPHWFDLDPDAPGCERGCGGVPDVADVAPQLVAAHHTGEVAMTAVFRVGPRALLLVDPAGEVRTLTDEIPPGAVSQIRLAHRGGPGALGWVVTLRIEDRIHVFFAGGAAGAPVSHHLLPGEAAGHASLITTREDRVYVAYLGDQVTRFLGAVVSRTRQLYLLEVAPEGPANASPDVPDDRGLRDLDVDWSSDANRGVALADTGSDLAVVAPVTGDGPAWLAAIVDAEDVSPLGLTPAQAARGDAWLAGAPPLFGYAGGAGAWAIPVALEGQTFGEPTLVDPQADAIHLATLPSGPLALLRQGNAPAGRRCRLAVLDAAGAVLGQGRFEDNQCNQATVATDPQGTRAVVATTRPFDALGVRTDACE